MFSLFDRRAGLRPHALHERHQENTKGEHHRDRRHDPQDLDQLRDEPTGLKPVLLGLLFLSLSHLPLGRFHERYRAGLLAQRLASDLHLHSVPLAHLCKLGSVALEESLLDVAALRFLERCLFGR